MTCTHNTVDQRTVSTTEGGCPICLKSKLAELRLLLAGKDAALERIKRHDKTNYKYGGGNRFGEKPAPGSRWTTPCEIAEAALALTPSEGLGKVREVLEAGLKGFRNPEISFLGATREMEKSIQEAIALLGGSQEPRG